MWLPFDAHPDPQEAVTGVPNRPLILSTARLGLQAGADGPGREPYPEPRTADLPTGPTTVPCLRTSGFAADGALQSVSWASASDHRPAQDGLAVEASRTRAVGLAPPPGRRAIRVIRCL